MTIECGLSEIHDNSQANRVKAFSYVKSFLNSLIFTHLVKNGGNNMVETLMDYKTFQCAKA